MKATVSLITYNHEAYIAQALEGVLMQEVDFDYEIIVGEDCSTDRTRDIVLAFQRRYPEQVRAILPDRNLGQGGMRILAQTLRAAQGDYIARLDGDDYWTSPHKLQRQVDFLERHPDCSMCFHNVLQVHEDGSSPPSPHNGPDQQRFTTTRDILRHCYIPGCSPMFRRAVVDQLPAWYFNVIWGDWPLHIVAGEFGKIGYLDEILGVWRIHPNGFWSGRTAVQQLQGVIDFYHVVNRGTNYRYADVIAGCLSHHYHLLAKAHLAHGDHRQARGAARRGLYSNAVRWRGNRRKLLRVLFASFTAPARRWLRTYRDALSVRRKRGP